ncbi:MAG TPA: hypothetical protein DCS07_09605 [Bdellovibrionales bacterium]|nr:MAG: hypothetical protein A2Z97_15530 [Bdellovibrionales bacterium GWB1_52_6]OFZ03976.1 MAG: hypothetical protein A2X97_08575 [Bdellovibrionales bacterium GWA1_52_35]OFZ40712.1 MAG: hypothetical protein A2070_08515 [Bdellovibrionales bacterium GWC1_52_8]HAR42867.1 hypothetical protein [Bdellovibrionales bacterium]HCM39789.1 hypothetical protein [Bdellovibrionales bacterium]
MSIMRGSLLVLAMLNVSLISSGCGKDQGQSLVQGVQISTHQESEDVYLALTTQLNTGATQFVALNVSIADPKYPGEFFGSLGLKQAFNGTAELTLDLNVSKLANHQFSIGSKLPNGTDIPVGGLGNVPVIGIPIGDNGSRIYFAYGTGVAMVGAAIVIGEFNGLGGYVGNANIFPMFDFGHGVRGLGGVFAGQQKNQSGVAVFVDASTALTGAANELAVSKSIGMAKIAAADQPAPKLTFNVPATSQGAKDKVNKALLKLHSKKARLHAQ